MREEIKKVKEFNMFTIAKEVYLGLTSSELLIVDLQFYNACKTATSMKGLSSLTVEDYHDLLVASYVTGFYESNEVIPWI